MESEGEFDRELVREPGEYSGPELNKTEGDVGFSF